MPPAFSTESSKATLRLAEELLPFVYDELRRHFQVNGLVRPTGLERATF
jgi:hypothetical protein